MRLSELITVLQRLVEVADMRVRVNCLCDRGVEEIGCVYIETYKTVDPYVVIEPS